MLKNINEYFIRERILYSYYLMAIKNVVCFDDDDFLCPHVIFAKM